jgi:hypothetical protein
VYRLTPAELAYNNSVHASKDVMDFHAKKGFYASIEDTVLAILGDESVLDLLDARAWADRPVELQVAIEQQWKKVTATQQKYSNRNIKHYVFTIG